MEADVVTMRYENANTRFPYSVADTTSGPNITLQENGTLALSFVDYKGRVVAVVFHDVLGVKYQNNAFDESGRAEDCAIEVIESDWLRQTCDADRADVSQYRHLIVGFNERGMALEVLFSTITEANKAVNPSDGSRGF